MRDLALAVLAPAALAGCASAPEPYPLGQGDANYDALRSASEACRNRGGEVRPRENADGRDLKDYLCVFASKGS